MSRFENHKTNVVVSVADDKDDRFANGWTKVDGEAKKPARKTAASKSES